MRSGLDWNGSRPRMGLVRGFLYNLCHAFSSCFYMFCCCWLLEDCFLGQRSLHGPIYGPPEPGLLPPPPRVYHVGHGLLGPNPGPSGPPPPPGPGGYRREPGPPF